MTPQVAAVNATGFTLATITLILIGLRLYGASIGVVRLRLDFYLVVVATIFALATLAVFHIACNEALGQHLKYLIEHVPIPTIISGLRLLWIWTVLGLVAGLLAKGAVAAMMFQLTTFMQTWQRAFLVFVTVLNFVAGIVLLATTGTQCEPHAFLYDKVLKGTCPRVKLALVANYVQAERSLVTRDMTHGHDPTWEVTPLLGWGTAELWMILVIASMPPLRPLFRHWFNRERIVAQSGSHATATTPKPTKATQEGQESMMMVINVPAIVDGEHV
ncbi:hypothetical protein ANO11243_056970 [Dothideomycetidae sp. 11243]|nr:hypothetical protein ANO11243_056970 [fungal sp. No.11243]